MRLTMVMVKASRMAGRASASSTLKTICMGVAPMARAASISPLSISRIAASTRRAKKGMVAMVSGTMAAVVPIDVPVRSRVKGMIATTRMMKGVERAALTMSPTARLSAGAGKSSPLPLVARKMPIGRPISEPRRPEAATICSVWSSDFHKRSISISGDIAEHLRGKAGFGIEAVGACDDMGRCRIGDDERAERLARDLLDGAGKDVDVAADLGDEPRRQRLEGRRAEEGEAHEDAVAGRGRGLHAGAQPFRQAGAERGGKKDLRRLVLRCREDVKGRPLLDDAALVDDRDMRGD